MRVLRHEEFSEGCEATCNGPYGGAWSKTMVGYGPEVSNFVLELTYNYGIDSYEQGNDLQYIALHCFPALERARALGYQVVDNHTIIGPDNYKYRILPYIPHRAEQFVCVALRVSNMANSLKYWVELHGMKKIQDMENIDGLQAAKSEMIGFSEEDCLLQLIEVGDGEAVDHALSGGRVAFACKSVPEIFNKVSSEGYVIQTPPLTLPTPGKADVVVTILQDPDGYEICFVEDDAFYDLATPKYDVIDWEERGSRGGDGVPLKKGRDNTTPTAGETALLQIITSEEDLKQAIARANAASKTMVIDFGASWCKNCKKISSQVKNLADVYKNSVVVTDVDIDDCEDIADEYGVTSIPRFIALKNGQKVDDYLGSGAEQLAAFFAKLA